jgi:hypothetical protein
VSSKTHSATYSENSSLALASSAGSSSHVQLPKQCPQRPIPPLTLRIALGPTASSAGRAVETLFDKA